MRASESNNGTINIVILQRQTYIFIRSEQAECKNVQLFVGLADHAYEIPI